MKTMTLKKSAAGLVLAATAMFGLVSGANAQSLLEMALQNGWTFEQFQAAMNMSGGGSTTTTTTTTTGACGTTTGYTATSTLRPGMSGAAVSALQTALNNYAASALVIDGSYGPATSSAVMAFQASRGLGQDGIAGPNTQGALVTASTMTVPCTDNSGNTGGNTGANLNDGTQGSIDSWSVTSSDESEINEGESDVEIYAIDLELDNDGDLLVQSIDVWFAATTAGDQSNDPWDYFEEVTLMVDGEAVDTVDADSASDWSDEVDAETNINTAGAGEEYRVRFTGLDFIMEADETTTVSVAVTAANTIDGDDDGETWNVTFGNIRIVDGTGFVTNFNQSTALEDSFTVNATAEEGEITVRDSNNNPEASLIEVDDSNDTNEVTVYGFEIEEDNGVDLNIEEMTLTFTVLDEDGNAEADDRSVMRRAYIYQGNTKVGDEAMTDDGVVLFDNLDIDVDADDTEEFSVRVDFEDTNNQVRYENGTTISVVVTSLTKFEDANGNDEGDIDETINGGSETHELRTAGIMVSDVTVTEVKTVACDGACAAGVGEQAQFKFEFDVTAFGGNMFIDNVVEAAGTGHTYTLNGVGGAVAPSMIAPGVDTADTSTWEISEGDTETFVITINYTADAAEFVNIDLTAIQWSATDVAEDNAASQQYQFEMDRFESDPTYLNFTAA